MGTLRRARGASEFSIRESTTGLTECQAAHPGNKGQPRSGERLRLRPGDGSKDLVGGHRGMVLPCG